MLLKSLLLLTLTSMCTIYAFGQVGNDISIQKQVLATIDFYKSHTAGYISLYNGIEYTGSYPGTTGHPYFKWDTLQQGSIKYNGIYYPQVGLKYDLVSDELVLLGKQNLAISLIPSKIDYFTLGEHLYINNRQDTATQHSGQARFYEVLYNGSVVLLANRSKKVERSSRVEDPFIFKPYNYYFIKKNNDFIQVSSEKAFLNIFNGQRENLRQYIRKNNLNFRKDFEASLMQATRYVDQLTN
jgi:hypothetical protein